MVGKSNCQAGQVHLAAWCCARVLPLSFASTRRLASAEALSSDRILTTILQASFNYKASLKRLCFLSSHLLKFSVQTPASS